MGWLSEDLLHEGYVIVELADGARTMAANAAGPVVRLPDGSEEQHSDDELVAWQLACDCSTPSEYGDSPGTMSRWLGARWERVATQRVEDVDRGKLYAPVGGAVDLFEDRPELEKLARTMWRAHLIKAGALREIQSNVAAIGAAEASLSKSVARARAAGWSWEDIGRAAGMSRQSAHARWAETLGV